MIVYAFWKQRIQKVKASCPLYKICLFPTSFLPLPLISKLASFLKFSSLTLSSTNETRTLDQVSWRNSNSIQQGKKKLFCLWKLSLQYESQTQILPGIQANDKWMKKDQWGLEWLTPRLKWATVTQLHPTVAWNWAHWIQTVFSFLLKRNRKYNFFFPSQTVNSFEF